MCIYPDIISWPGVIVFSYKNIEFKVFTAPEVIAETSKVQLSPIEEKMFLI
ncbi:Uncharacterised protein [Acinetobacter baumannii]|nr:Uncharacterised protein [Acinetobacter baumannii]SSR16128.1 Uncharacterised protein [Acinetobacter baumannii]SSR35779.1 Uncharacterised protein [Acinetobacter baumannii]SSV38339.1 Uncharacterised protein [Acinetobacter baumannii]SSV39541.1 Uncharacterised protein [Acinetobacter baumannii]